MFRVGRPFGGLAVLWRKTFGTALTIESLDNSRLMLCRLMHGNTTTTLLMPICLVIMVPMSTNSLFYLSKIDSVLTCYVQAAAIGDCNSNITSSHHGFGTELKSFCASENLTISDSLLCKGDNYYILSSVRPIILWLG